MFNEDETVNFPLNCGCCSVKIKSTRLSFDKRLVMVSLPVNCEYELQSRAVPLDFKEVQLLRELIHKLFVQV